MAMKSYCSSAFLIPPQTPGLVDLVLHYIEYYEVLNTSSPDIAMCNLLGNMPPPCKRLIHLMA